MPRYDIEALEKWETIAFYINVEAASKDEAIEKVRRGDCAYDSHKHPGSDDEFVGVLYAETVEEWSTKCHCSK